MARNRARPPGGERGTVVIISSVHWHFTWQRHQDIATRLAERGYAVTFIEPLPKRWPHLDEMGRVLGRLMGSREKAGNCPQRESPGVMVESPLMLPETGAVSSAINRRLLLPRLVASLGDLRSAGPLIVISYLPLAGSNALIRRLDPDLLVYDCVFDWESDPTSRSASHQGELLEMADLVFADSTFLYERVSARHTNVHRISAAVDLEAFLGRTGDRPRLDPPRVGYFGNIADWLDVDLLRKISHRYPLRLIGPLRISLDGFGEMLEVVGAVPQGDVAAHLADVDVLLLPYKEETNRAVLPAKTFECLATGLPGVAIGLPNLAIFEDLFYLCSTHEEVFDAIDRAAVEEEGLAEHRTQVAEANSWDQRIEEIDGLLAREVGRRRYSADEDPVA